MSINSILLRKLEYQSTLVQYNERHVPNSFPLHSLWWDIWSLPVPCYRADSPASGRRGGPHRPDLAHQGPPGASLWAPGGGACQDQRGRAGGVPLLRHRLPRELPACDWQLQRCLVTPVALQSSAFTLEYKHKLSKMSRSPMFINIKHSYSLLYIRWIRYII